MTPDSTGQNLCVEVLVHLAAGHIEGQGIAFSVRAKVDFRGEAAARAAERFPILIPPFAPAACWCARTMVESMACSSSAGGPARQRLKYRIPHPELAPAGEAHEGRIPLAIAFGQVAPRRARAQHPENAVHRSPLVPNGRTTLAPIR